MCDLASDAAGLWRTNRVLTAKVRELTGLLVEARQGAAGSVNASLRDLNERLNADNNALRSNIDHLVAQLNEANEQARATAVNTTELVDKCARLTRWNHELQASLVQPAKGANEETRDDPEGPRVARRPGASNPLSGVGTLAAAYDQLQVRYDNAGQASRCSRVHTTARSRCAASCEPLLGPIRFDSPKGIDWVVVDGESRSDRKMEKA